MLQITSTPQTLTLTHKPRGEVAIAIAATLVFAVVAVLFFAAGNDAGVIFLVFAISGPTYLYFFLETREITFDRAKDTVTLSTRSPRGASATPHPLTGLARAVVHRATPRPEKRAVDAELAAPPRGNFRTVLLFEDGTELALSEGYTKGKTAFEETRTINGWLG